jgi:hypothetical protein
VSGDTIGDLGDVTLPELIAQLAAHPAVLGLVRYGSRALDDDSVQRPLILASIAALRAQRAAVLESKMPSHGAWQDLDFVCPNLA